MVSLFLVASGRIRLERSLEDGSWVSLHVAQGPALLAEASLFAERYHCDAVAEIATEVQELGRDDVERALAADPDLASLLLRRLASEVRDLRSRLELRSVRPVERRVLLGLELDRGADRTVATRAAELGLAPETLVARVGAARAAGQDRARGPEDPVALRARRKTVTAVMARLGGSWRNGRDRRSIAVPGTARPHRRTPCITVAESSFSACRS